MSKYAILKKIEQLEPLKDHQEISFLSGSYDFPWDTQRALELALIRTFAIPKSAALLESTREFTERTQKRYDDTTIIISTIGFYGYDSPEGLAAIRRMNQIHSRYAIPNDEFLYVLTTFVFEPIRWNVKYGWRPFSENEKQAVYYFWCEVGKRMNITGIPETIEALEHYNRDYEKRHFAFAESNRVLAIATRDLFLSWVLPKALWPLGAPLVHAMMDAPMRAAFGFAEPPLWAKGMVTLGLWARKQTLRLLPPRKEPYRLPATRTYPKGYDIKQIGPQLP